MKTCNLLNGLWRSLWVCVLAAMLSGLACANNIRIIGAPKVDKEGTSGIAAIKFDIAWDNSWRTPTPNNHDAAWIYVKCWDGEAWRHVYLEETGHIPGSTTLADAVNPGLVYQVSDIDGANMRQPMELKPGYSMAWKEWLQNPEEEATKCVVGLFLYRKNYGSGHVVVPGVSLKWKYTDQTFTPDDDLTVKVFAVEMVYVPEGGYYLGGIGNATWLTGSFTTNKTTIGSPMYITSENEITVANTAAPSTLWAGSSAIEAGTIPASYPKGYNAFYIMKYELTQEAYVEFLNTLNQGQQKTRIQGNLDNLGEGSYAWGSDVSSWRNAIMIMQEAPNVVFGMDGNKNGIYNEIDTVCYGEVDASGNCLGRKLQRNIDGQDWAVNFVCMQDLLAYAEFSGLRPMTEMEFEKACRGPRNPVLNEFAWGNATVTFCHGKNRTLLGEATGTEKPEEFFNAGAWVRNGTNVKDDGTTLVAPYNNNRPGPLRVGCFADSTTNRTASGASYWGVMNLSDNLAEMCISAGWKNGWNFVGVHGSGLLDDVGETRQDAWWLDATWKCIIIRGMQFYNDNAGVKGLISEGPIYTGMVSSRHRRGWTIGPANRQSASEYMRGIRCVRTDNAER